MSRVTLESNDAFHLNIRNRMTWGTNIQALAGNITIDADAPVLNFLDTGGVARTVLMPPPVRGRMFIFYNTSAGAFALNIKKLDGTTNAVAVAQGKGAYLFSDGVDWYGAPFA